MGKNTSIEWCDHSWPVINGCRRVSEGCRRCYAEKLTATRLRTQPKYKDLAVYTEGGPRWTGESRLWLPHLGMPLTIKKPSRIFVADMGDLFFEGNSNEEIAAVFGVMAACPQHTFQVLTKRPQRAADWFAWIAATLVSNGGPDVNAARGVRWHAWNYLVDEIKVHNDSQPWVWPLPNVHLGISAENQDAYNERFLVLVHQCPAAVYWVSAEPLLGPIRLRGTGHIHANWIVVGGESGSGARPMHPDWARSLRDECAESGIRFFFKQWGQWGPSSDGQSLVSLGKKHSGRLLDGRTWDEFPEVG